MRYKGSVVNLTALLPGAIGRYMPPTYGLPTSNISNNVVVLPDAGTVALVSAGERSATSVSAVEPVDYDKFDYLRPSYWIGHEFGKLNLALADYGERLLL
jgi:hypothetical protein